MKAKKNRKNIPEDDTPIYLTPESTLQTPAEYEHDKEQDVTRDESISVSKDDIRDTGANWIAGKEEEVRNSED